MKQVVRFVLGEYGYRRKGKTSDGMILLSMFLTTDYIVFRKFNFIEGWLKNPDQYYISGNMTYSEKKNGIISIGDLFEKEPIVKFNLSIDKFFKLLRDWEEVAKKHCKEIIITKEGDEVTVEGEN